MLTAAQRSYINHIVSSEYDVKQGLKPPMSDREFAKTLGVHYNSLLNWKKHKEFQDRLRAAREEFERGKDYFALVMRARSQEAMVMQYETATGTEKRHYLKMILDESRKVEDYQEIEPYQDFTDEKLAEIVMQRHIKVRGVADDRIREIAEGAEE
jgi:hypothetical protein